MKIILSRYRTHPMVQNPKCHSWFVCQEKARKLYNNMGDTDATVDHSDSAGTSVSAGVPVNSKRKGNVFVQWVRNVFGYRKTSLALFVVASLVFTVLFSYYDNNLAYTITLPSERLEIDVLDKSWLDLQRIGEHEHSYGAVENDRVHDYLQLQIKNAIVSKEYIQFDNDLNYTNNILFATESSDFTTVNYYESNNLLVRINGTDSSLPALLLSAHYDSVPTSYGVTDDGMGIASLLGVLYYYCSEKVSQPKRTIIFNFNNHEEFGLHGATSFLSHPWFNEIDYFLNLEGTGAGGKAILFRGTDYGMINHFKNVRFPYGTSIFQQGFNNRMIHSETDYKVYKEGGLRGLDLAFYKPRDLYHTAGDNIRNINIKSLWHMLSNSLDFVEGFVADRIDLDEDENVKTELGIYTSFLNCFFSIPISKLIFINIVSLILSPVLSLFLLVVVLQYKKNWKLNFINVIKFPISLLVSSLILNGFVTFTKTANEFLPNSSFGLIVFTLFALFLVANYIVLNIINLIFSKYKLVNHDEKLVVIVEISAVYWVILLWSTIKLSFNKPLDDHTGEFPIVIVFWLQSFASIFGLLGWSFRPPNRDQFGQTEETEPLLNNRVSDEDYGSQEENISDVTSTFSNENDNKLVQFIKNASYDWSLQFLIIVPISSLVLYNSGFLILDGINKSIQESLNAENQIFKIIQLFVTIWALPFLPFVFKFNRIIVLSLLIVIISGFVGISVDDPFDSLNPLKLRFVQVIDLDVNAKESTVQVFGRTDSPVREVLSDIPSVKKYSSVECISLEDGMDQCSYSSNLIPEFVPGKPFEEYVQVEILKNSSDIEYPYGLLTGEIKITTPKNRYCSLTFQNAEASTEEFYKDRPVKTVIIYNDKKNTTLNQDADIEGIPEGFSRDKYGNYIFKKLNGINEFQLNKLDWDKPYHIGFQWVPNILDRTAGQAGNKVGISITCHWTDLEPVSDSTGIRPTIPAYFELLHYSPNYVSWANKEKGLVRVSRYIEV